MKSAPAAESRLVARPMTGSTPSPSYVCATSEQGSVVGIRVEVPLMA